MKAPPPGLPPANSRKWHSRRWWDGLGYLRVRSLSNPAWQRDTTWLVHFLTTDRDAAPPDERPLCDDAIIAARRYPRTAAGAVEPDTSWDEVLAAIDLLLVVRQEHHVARVQAAQQEDSSA